MENIRIINDMMKFTDEKNIPGLLLLIDFEKSFDSPSWYFLYKALETGPRSAVGNVSGNRCESDCRSKGHEFDTGPVPYFRGD